jgi:BirA family biotin operon repressor/biotin-[acetyl-CoA-carboxylase] ligase
LPKIAPPFDTASVRARLPGRRVDWFESIGSTMIEARKPLEPARIVVAGEQTSGIGRHGRRWHSEAGTGLYVSLVLAAEPLPVLTLALGLATRDAIAQVTSLTPDLRWPNDVLLREKKCAGILAHVESGAVIAGIGINVSQRSFPAGLDTPATSLALEGGNVSREDLLVALAHAVDRYCTILSVTGPDAIVRLFSKNSSYAAGRRVRADVVEGVTTGLDSSGFLVIREDSGKETTIFAGGVRPV